MWRVGGGLLLRRHLFVYFALWQTPRGLIDTRVHVLVEAREDAPCHAELEGRENVFEAMRMTKVYFWVTGKILMGGKLARNELSGIPIS